MPTPKGTKPWNAGTSKGWIDKRGYRWLYLLENGKRRARREHRVIMERALGRRLEPWELIHHKNGDPSDNRLENLSLEEWGVHTANHHAGSRRSYDTKRSLEAFALLREELKAVRRINAELLAALERTVHALAFHVEAAGNCVGCDAEYLREAREAIIKAKGA